MIRRALRGAYGIYAAVAFAVVILMVFCPLLIATPALRVRRSIGRLTVRAWLLTIGVPLRVKGLEHLPAGPCIVVCNHASYVDGIVLTAVLPERFDFLVQHRAGDWPYIGLILRRMGVRFVNRERPRSAARAARGLLRAARRGTSLTIFPEGTFCREPRLQPFFEGAFFIAARSSVPIVPAVIRGSRQLLADGSALPAWSRLSVEVFAPLTALGSRREDSRELLQRAFRVVASQCREPAVDGMHSAAPARTPASGVPGEEPAPPIADATPS